MKSWLRKFCFACACVAALGLLVALAVGGIFSVQHLAEEPEDKRLLQDAPPAGAAPGSVVLSLSSAAVVVEAGPAGGPIRIESSFDPDIYELGQEYEEDGAGGWNYRLDFHEKTLFHVSVVGIWLGKRSPEVRVWLPRDLPFTLDIKMQGGYLSLDLAGMELTSASVELDRGVLGLIASEPLAAPMERLSVQGRMGTMSLMSLGNASPKELHVEHGLGAALVDLDGAWQLDADVDFQMAFGKGELRLPPDIRIEGLDHSAWRRVDPGIEEFPTPTLRISTHFDMGDIRVTEGTFSEPVLGGDHTPFGPPG